MTTRVSKAARLFREPLFHFLVIGALLFAGFHWGSGGPGSDRIVVTSGQIDQMVAGFSRTWQRPPDEAELKGLIDEFLREEMASREAEAMGLDRDDAIIRRRLRQKLEFLAEDEVLATPPTEEQMQAWLDSHSETFRVETRIAFRQVYLNPELRADTWEHDAKRLLGWLSEAGPRANIDTLGDRSLLPQEVPQVALSEVATQFGSPFAGQVAGLEPLHWAGPIQSGFGAHLVCVIEREPGRPLTLAEARPQVERDILASRRRQHVNVMYERLLARYRVTIEDAADSASAKGDQP